jgi:integrase
MTRRTRSPFEAPAPGVQVIRLKNGDARYRARRKFDGKVVLGELREVLADAIEDTLDIAKKRDKLPRQLLTFRMAVAKTRERLVTSGNRYATLVWFDNRSKKPLAFFADTPLHRIGEDEIGAYIRSRRAGNKDLSNNALLHDKRFLSLVFAPAVRSGQLKANPVNLFTWPSLEENLPDVLLPDELSKLVTSVREQGTPIDAAVIVLLCGTGLRLSEAARLRVGDIDLEHFRLRVTKAKRKPRSIALRKELLPAVELLLDGRHRWKKRHDEYVFLPYTNDGIADSDKNRQGKPREHVKPADEIAHERRTEVINRVLEHWSDALKEPRLHAHALRHSCGVALAMAGWTPYEIRDFLGHKGLGMVSLYTQQVPQRAATFAGVKLPV